MLARLAPVLCAILASCSSGSGTAGGTGPTPAPAPTPLPAPPAPLPPAVGAASSTSLVVVRHPPTAATAQFLELDLAPLLATGAAPGRGQAFELQTLSHPWHQGRFVVAASQGGSDLVITSLRIGSGPTLVHRVIGRPEQREVEMVTLTPSAVHVGRGVAYVGAGDRVGFVDLRDARLRFTQVHQRTLSERKAFDLIVHSGDWLVAVDDMVMPMWADSFRLDARGLPTHRAGWQLPGVINGHYTLGALLGASGDGTLVLAAPYSIMDGHGHDLVALGVHGHALDPLPDHLTLQNARGEAGAPPLLEEHVPRGRPADPPSLHGGAAYTEWTALALLGSDTPTPELVFAAGARGLMVLPVAFTATSTATLVDVGGHCLDVVERSGALVALVGDAPPNPYAPPPTTAPPAPGPSRLVLVRREGGVLRAVATHSLDAPHTSFVH